jgi:hypothetical protein
LPDALSGIFLCEGLDRLLGDLPDETGQELGIFGS